MFTGGTIWISTHGHLTAPRLLFASASAPRAVAATPAGCTSRKGQTASARGETEDNRGGGGLGVGSVLEAEPTINFWPTDSTWTRGWLSKQIPEPFSVPNSGMRQNRGEPPNRAQIISRLTLSQPNKWVALKKRASPPAEQKSKILLQQLVPLGPPAAGAEGLQREAGLRRTPGPRNREAKQGKREKNKGTRAKQTSTRGTSSRCGCFETRHLLRSSRNAKQNVRGPTCQRSRHGKRVDDWECAQYSIVPAVWEKGSQPEEEKNRSEVRISRHHYSSHMGVW